MHNAEVTESLGVWMGYSEQKLHHVDIWWSITLALVVNDPRHWVLSGHAQSILDHWCNLNPVSEFCEAVLGSFFWNHNGLNKLPTRLADPTVASLWVNHSTCDWTPILIRSGVSQNKRHADRLNQRFSFVYDTGQQCTTARSGRAPWWLTHR